MGTTTEQSPPRRPGCRCVMWASTTAATAIAGRTEGTAPHSATADQQTTCTSKSMFSLRNAPAFRRCVWTLTMPSSPAARDLLTLMTLLPAKAREALIALVWWYGPYYLGA